MVALLLGACEGTIGDVDDDRPNAQDPSVEAPTREPVGSAEFDPSRQMRRMSADQLRLSLEQATGQSWRDYDDLAGALGRADLAEVTEDSRIVNVTFAKVLDDVARQMCDDAVENDLERGEAERLILRHTGDTHDDAANDENLRHLMYRFWSMDVPEGDARLEPWRALLSEPLENDDPIERWKLVCVGLLTHPNFFTY